MILTGTEIHRQVKLGNIIINPFSVAQLNPNSYNYRLDINYKEKFHCKSGCASYSDLMKIPDDGLILKPKTIYLSSIAETIDSEKYVMSVIGRSSVGRLGIFVQIPADLDSFAGTHNWALELTCVQPIKIYPSMIIGQVSFWRPDGNIEVNEGKYHAFNVHNEPVCKAKR